MNDWQTWLTIGLCCVAAAYIAWRAWRTVAARKAAGCGSGCSSCADNSPAQPRGPLLTIERGQLAEDLPNRQGRDLS